MEIMSEAAALAIWARAAQLQAEASPSALVRSDDSDGTTSLVLDPETRAPTGMYRADEVAQAALEAGIAAEFVAIAMAEHDALGADATTVAQELAPGDRARLVGHAATSVRASRVIREGADVVLDRLRTLAGEAPYHLEFDAALGPHPLQGGVLRFSVPAWGAEHTGGTLNGFLYHAARMSVTDMHITLTPRGTAEAPGCELSVTVDLRRGQRFNTRFFSTLSRLLVAAYGGVGLVAGGLVGPKLFAGTSALIGGSALGAAVGLGSVVAFNAFLAAILRWEHRMAHRAITAALEDLLQRVQRPGDADRVFGTAAPVRPRLTRRDDPGASMVRARGGLLPGVATA